MAAPAVPPRRGRDLPWLMFNRRVRPLSLGLSLACLVVFWTDVLKREDAGETFDHGSPEGIMTGLLALVCVISLWAAFWRKNEQWMRWGLLGSAGIFSVRSAYILLDRGWDSTSMWLSVCIVIMASGAYLLERGDPV